MVGLAVRRPVRRPAGRRRGRAPRHPVGARSSRTEGTGIVHIAPGCGAEDYELGKAHGLPIIAPLDEYGIYLDGLRLAHRAWTSHDVAKPIVDRPQARSGSSSGRRPYEHRYPFCWRCKEKLVFRVEDEWFISATRSARR